MTDTAASVNQLTAEQRRAIETNAVSVSLSAGAGCGKTFVLTERFLAHFDPLDDKALGPGNLGRLVAITFTERAAREMRDRIRAKCYDRLLEAEPEVADYWSELLRSLDAARISTIHAFCGSLLRSRAVEAQLDPQFAVLEQAQADTLLSEVIDEVLRQLVADRDPLTIELAARFDLHLLDEMLHDLVRGCTAAEFDDWRGVSPDDQLARWHTFHDKSVLAEIGRELANTPAAQVVRAVLGEHEPDHPVMRERRRVLLDILTSLATTDSPAANLLADLTAIQANARVQGGGSAKSWDSAFAYERFKSAATKLRESAEAACAMAVFDREAAREAAVVGLQLLTVADVAQLRYTERKRELNALDFNDLLSRARALLVDPGNREMTRRLSSQIELLLVDEFQDTDPLQVELVEALCGGDLAGGKLFFVGDYKQSIYRFRGAKPHVFRKLRDRTPAAGQLSLTLNFRSQPAILDFVNALFHDDLGDGYEPLRPSRPQVSPKPAVEFLWAPGSPTDRKSGDRESKESLRRREADWIARRLRALIDSGQPIVWDSAAARAGRQAARPAQLSDVAILFRALSDVEIYEEALRRYGLDYYVVGGHAFYAQQEIFDLLNLLRAINSSSDLVSLVGVLRSGVFSLADETLFWLAGHPEGLSSGLFASQLPAEISATEAERVRFAARAISELRQLKDQVRICELIEVALERTGYDAVLLSEFMGERKLANLRKLIEQARTFERGDLFDLSDFIAQLADYVVHQPDEPLAATHSENTNVVRLMTIHQSKGLEFPIVVVPDLDRPRHNRAAGVHFDPVLGPLVRLPEGENGEPTLSGYDLWRFVERSEDAAELNRLLYVATTRAADYLILSSGVPEVGSASGPWLQLLSRRFDLNDGRFIGKLPAGAAMPEVRVTSQEPPPASRGERAPRVDIEAMIDEALHSPGSTEAPRRGIDTIVPSEKARRQYSFSRLYGTLHLPPQAEDDPDRLAERSVDPRGLGTLVHAVLAALDIHQPGNCQELVNRYAKRHLGEDPGQAAIAVQMIERFVASPRFAELAAAQEDHAEIEFLLRWPLAASAEPETLIGGYLDRLYRDARGDWHVLDFKTNRVGESGVVGVAAAYEMQMLVYGLATEQILGVPPASLTLHFLRTGAEHGFAWDAAARERAVRLVEMGIAASIAAAGAT
jgi:ATP-dependent helicase/nuclease subunit A